MPHFQLLLPCSRAMIHSVDIASQLSKMVQGPRAALLTLSPLGNITSDEIQDFKDIPPVIQIFQVILTAENGRFYREMIKYALIMSQLAFVFWL